MFTRFPSGQREIPGGTGRGERRPCRSGKLLTSLGLSPARRNLRGVLLRAYLQPLKYMLQEQPKEKEAPQVLGSLPWQAQVRLQHTACQAYTHSFSCPRISLLPPGEALLRPGTHWTPTPGTTSFSTLHFFPKCPWVESQLYAGALLPLLRACCGEKHMGCLRRWDESSQTPNRVTLCLNSDVLTSSHTDHTDRAMVGATGSAHSYLLQARC